MECARCLFSTDILPELIFDSKGLCSACSNYDSNLKIRTQSNTEGESYLLKLCEVIKSSKPKSSKYDCIIGLSGGVDSSYLALWAKNAGLNPLAVHLDNGWNSDEATHNIMSLVETLALDLHTEVLDWEEFRALQVSFLRASVPDVEIPTDHAIQSVLWKIADLKRIKWILSGMNYRTESPTSPEWWAYGHSDWKYIRSVNNRFGKTKLLKYPHYTLKRLGYWNIVKKIRIVSPLNYLDYDKNKAIELLQERIGWRNYGEKHHESVYTSFVQTFLLPEKFKINKKIAHLSDLIRSGQISKEEANFKLKETKYVDVLFVLKKLKLSEVEFNEILAKPVASFKDFPNNSRYIKRIKKVVNILRRWNIYPR